VNLKLHKPLCTFDLETTGVQVSKDRIVEIAILKVHPDGSRESRSWRVNPEMPIPPDSTAVHGISDADVADAPTFKEIAPKVVEMLRGSDLAGYNCNRFDIPLLAEELLRAGHDFDLGNHKTVDVQTIFHKKEPRDLSAAYRLYVGKNLENAHSAEADTHATFEILDAMMNHYEDLSNEVHHLHELSYYKKFADLAGFIHFHEDGEEIFSFGKYKGHKVRDVFVKDQGYYGWIQSADFPLYTKKVLTAIKLKSKF